MDELTANQFKEWQQSIGWSNQQVADQFRVSLKTIINWRSGATRIPYIAHFAVLYFNQECGQ